MVQARESSLFTRKYRRITAQANTRPFPRSGWGGDEHDEAVRQGDRPSAARGSDAPGVVTSMTKGTAIAMTNKYCADK